LSKFKSSIIELQVSCEATHLQVNVITNNLNIVMYNLNETMYALNSTITTVQQYGQAIAYLLENTHQFQNFTLTELERIDARITQYGLELTSYNQELTSIINELALDITEIARVVNQLGFVYDELIVQMGTQVAEMGNEDRAINVNLNTLWTYLAIVAIGFIIVLICLGLTLNRKIQKL
ncbi:unnamed protein product, partial [marine sediment metagenome]